MLTLLFLTPLLYYLPQATLAVIIIMAVTKLIRIEPMVKAWRVSRPDGLISLTTFACTLVMVPDLQIGIGIGVLLSVGAYLYRSMKPHMAYLARHGDGTLKEADVSELPIDQRIAILRFDGRLYFGDSGYFEDKVIEAVAKLPALRYLIIDAGSITQIDASGEQVLRQVIERLRSSDIDVFITRARRQLHEVLERAGTMSYIGEDHFFPGINTLWNTCGGRWNRPTRPAAH